MLSSPLLVENKAITFLRRAPVLSWFFAAGMVGVLVIRVRGSDPLVHLGVVAGCAALLVMGSWVERFVLRLGAFGPAPVHSIAIGQAALLVYFYARSALSYAVGVPGVSRWELYLLAAAAGAHLLSCRRPSEREPVRRAAGYALVWLLWWASTFTYLGYRSGRLEPPSSDPDLHALWARLTAEHGRLIYDLLPQNPAPVHYSSGFSALNALWIDLSAGSAVAVVNCQVALQACFAVALVLETVFALRDGPAPLISAGLIGLAHAVFSFPVNASASHLEGTPRLSHTALALLPLTFAARLSSTDNPDVCVLRSAILVASFAIAWSVAINPAHCFVELPILLGAGLLLALKSRSAPRHLHRGMFVVTTAAVGVLAMILVSDAWLRSVARGLPASLVTGVTTPSVPWRSALLLGFGRASSISSLSILPSSCVPSAQCPAFASALGSVVSSPIVFIGLSALFIMSRLSIAPRVTRGAVVVVAVALSLWVTAFLADFVPTVFSILPGQLGELLRGYAHASLVYLSALLSFALLGVTLTLGAEIVRALSDRLGIPGSRLAEVAAAAALAVACGALMMHRPQLSRDVSEAYSRNVHNAPISAMGRVLPEDVRLAKKAASLVRPGEKVLLPGVVVQMNQWEVWYFTLGGSRAIPLYSDIPFAFFHQGGGDAATPIEYRDHVCEDLDLPWLAEHGVVWVYESTQVANLVCIHSWPEAREKYFELKLHEGAASLWRLRSELIGKAKRDPLRAR